LRPLPFSGELIYSAIYWVTCALWIGPEVIASVVKRSKTSSTLQDRGSLRLIKLLWAIGIAAAFTIAIWLPQTAITWQRVGTFWAGICLMLLGTAFRWYSAQVLGKFFTFDVAILSGHALIETGPYRYIRHPSYTGALVTLVGIGLALGNWVALAVAVLCLSIAYVYRIRVEEAALIGALGDSYIQYRRRTWRLVPFLF
jgi:protein-S-isoprenylcysteine O-methyltransferase Ste14